MTARYSNDKPGIPPEKGAISIEFVSAEPLPIHIQYRPHGLPPIRNGFEPARTIQSLFQVMAGRNHPPSHPALNSFLNGAKTRILEYVDKVIQEAPQNLTGSNEGRTMPRAKKSARKSSLAPELETKGKTAKFNLEAPWAKSVKLAADFTEWEKYPLEMIRAENGVWSLTVCVTPGHHAYRYIVDDQWFDDPHSSERITNPFGTVNAVIHVV